MSLSARAVGAAAIPLYNIEDAHAKATGAAALANPLGSDSESGLDLEAFNKHWTAIGFSPDEISTLKDAYTPALFTESEAPIHVITHYMLSHLASCKNDNIVCLGLFNDAALSFKSIRNDIVFGLGLPIVSGVIQGLRDPSPREAMAKCNSDLLKHYQSRLFDLQALSIYKIGSKKNDALKLFEKKKKPIPSSFNEYETYRLSVEKIYECLCLITRACCIEKASSMWAAPTLQLGNEAKHFEIPLEVKLIALSQALRVRVDFFNQQWAPPISFPGDFLNNIRKVVKDLRKPVIEKIFTEIDAPFTPKKKELLEDFICRECLKPSYTEDDFNNLQLIDGLAIYLFNDRYKKYHVTTSSFPDKLLEVPSLDVNVVVLKKTLDRHLPYIEHNERAVIWLQEVYNISKKVAETISEANDPELNEFLYNSVPERTRRPEQLRSPYVLYVVMGRRSALVLENLRKSLMSLKEIGRLLEIRAEIYSTPMNKDDQKAIAEAMTDLSSAAFECFFNMHLGPMLIDSFIMERSRITSLTGSDQVTDSQTLTILNRLLYKLSPDGLFDPFFQEWESLVGFTPVVEDSTPLDKVSSFETIESLLTESTHLSQKPVSPKPDVEARAETTSLEAASNSLTETFCPALTEKSTESTEIITTEDEFKAAPKEDFLKLGATAVVESSFSDTSDEKAAAPVSSVVPVIEDLVKVQSLAASKKRRKKKAVAAAASLLPCGGSGHNKHIEKTSKDMEDQVGFSRRNTSYSEVHRAITGHGFVEDHTTGDHVIYAHGSASISVPKHRVLKTGLLHSLMKKIQNILNNQDVDAK